MGIKQRVSINPIERANRIQGNVWHEEWDANPARNSYREVYALDEPVVDIPLELLRS